MEKKNRPGTHFLVERIEDLADQDEALRQAELELQPTERRETFIFVHGFNTSFEGALCRAAQLAADLDLEGPVFLYSWPSRGSVLSYFTDRNERIDPLTNDLADFLLSITQLPSVRKLHLLAHSMGSEFLLDALSKAQSGDSPAFNELVFASPDVDLDRFNTAVPLLTPLVDRITVYTSEKDRALALSARLQGGPRAGSIPGKVSSSEATTVVDTTPIKGTVLGHDDYTTSAIDDLRSLIWCPEPVSPAQKTTILSKVSNEEYWQFLPELTDEVTEAFGEALRLIRRLGGDEATEYVKAQKKLCRRQDPDRLQHYNRVGADLTRLLSRPVEGSR